MHPVEFGLEPQVSAFPPGYWLEAFQRKIKKSAATLLE
jgi:hypothetical protein